jgi:hypothetical protein
VRRQYDPGEASRDVSRGRWLEELLWTWGPGSTRTGVAVGCVVPEGFAAYARVLHPAQRERGNRLEPVRWSEVAAWTGRTAHAQMQFPRIANLALHESPSWGFLPSEGSLPPAEADRLVAILRPFTATPDRCWFAVWEGFGVPELQAFNRYPRIRVPHRAYFLFQGPIEAAASLTFGNFETTPQLWWPEDRRWCVASEIDFCDTYVAASEPCVEQITTDPNLEAFPTTLEARVDADGDTINGLSHARDRNPDEQGD